MFIRSGTGDDQVRRVTGYIGSTKVATVDRAWGTNPDATSGYVMLPAQVFSDTELETMVKGQADQALVDYDVATVGDVPTAAEVVTALMAHITDGTLTYQTVLQAILAATAGKTSGGATLNPIFRDSGDSLDRIDATVDTSGNRTVVTITPDP